MALKTIDVEVWRWTHRCYVCVKPTRVICPLEIHGEYGKNILVLDYCENLSAILPGKYYFVKKVIKETKNVM